MTKKQYLGIRYPFTSQDFQNFYIDLNSSLKGKVKSQIMHVIFTPKGQRLRNPEFGTDLIKYIFDPNDTATWESVKNEIKDSVSRWVNNVNLKDIQIVKNVDDDLEIFVRVDYTINIGNKSTDDSMVVQL
jgi:gene 25-like lysozyme|nr:MAG TPA: Baseplate wedge protein [Caudoviricetes sp.]